MKDLSPMNGFESEGLKNNVLKRVFNVHGGLYGESRKVNQVESLFQLPCARSSVV